MQKTNKEYFEFSRPEIQALVNPNSQKILDVGCASGMFGSQIKEKLSAEVWGIEPVEEIGEKAKEVIDKVFIGRIEDHICQLPDKYFDSIIFSDVLEHLEDPYSILDIIKEKLSNDGEIIASIPNVRHWSVLKGLLEGKWEYQDAGILDRTHLRFFTKSSIKKMFQNAGYKITNISATKFGENKISPKLLNALTQSEINVSSLAEEINHYQYLLKVTPQKSLQGKNSNLPLVSIIILTYNALKYTKKCIQSIIDKTNYPYEIIFVDNASTDGSVDYLRGMIKDHDNYKLIENKKNEGFAAGNNIGVTEANGKYIMLLNNDVLVSDVWLTQMIKSLEKHEKIGIVGPVTNHISGRQSYRNQYDGDNFEDFAAFIRKENKNRLTPRRRLAGFAMLMRKEVFEQVNGFDDTFGVGNFEDDDLSLKVRSLGFSLMVDESVFIHHYGSQTFKANHINILENLNERLPVFQKKWPNVDYEELLEIKNPLDKLHSEMIYDGIQSLENSDYADAENQFFQILSENPICQEALYGLVLCFRNSGDIQKAKEHLDDLLQLNPNHAEALNQFGLILLENGNISEAKTAFISSVKNAPEFIEVQRNLAEIFILEEDFKMGIQTYLTILKNHPEDIPSLLRMAELNREAENTQEALEWAKLVLQLEPENTLANQIINL
ncbi:MAG: hypothetical protein CMG69_05905 [Candidatus Marinimicrobia bacterium]|nr:hypothetical protein [Candidatus Neomarinimicrobiota bacterium]|tara:strand:+ start:13270 stop:15264 length:1995 start_codon:yes stop_codon:yes gene_type:complete